VTLETNDLRRHLSGQFNEDLLALHTDVLEMGGLVTMQLRDAVHALEHDDAVLARRVVERDPDVNAFELRLDEECRDVLVRRQPAAGDLRLVFAVIKVVIDLERMGDQAKRVAGATLEASGRSQERFGSPIAHLGVMVLGLVDKALDAFGRLDVPLALDVLRDDRAIDAECKAITRQLLTYMMEDARTIGAALYLVWATRALERIGDHAKNIADYVVYAVHGKDLRHMKDAERAERLPQPPG
jgi:phosphate transport system protein